MSKACEQGKHDGCDGKVRVKVPSTGFRSPLVNEVYQLVDCDCTHHSLKEPEGMKL